MSNTPHQDANLKQQIKEHDAALPANVPLLLFKEQEAHSLEFHLALRKACGNKARVLVIPYGLEYLGTID
ncbi:hypothetical protein [Labrys sp. 22185]|uniref:hypothetical protein n=1 Tax=Labrys sp. 22185 TaxID=3453888 RepID=UPI003F867555